MVFWIDDQDLRKSLVKILCTQMGIECYVYSILETDEAKYQYSLLPSSMIVFATEEYYEQNNHRYTGMEVLKGDLNLLKLRKFFQERFFQ